MVCTSVVDSLSTHDVYGLQVRELSNVIVSVVRRCLLSL